MRLYFLREPATLANVFLVGGAIVFAIFPEYAAKWWLFLFFLAGHVIYIWHARKHKDRPLFQMNAWMLLLDIYAIAIRFPFP